MKQLISNQACRLMLSLCCAGVAVPAAAETVWITLDPVTAGKLKNAPYQVADRQSLMTNLGIANLVPEHQLPVLASIDDQDISILSGQIHQQLHRCGGFIAHNSLAEAMNATANPVSLAVFTPPPLTQGTLVNSMLPMLNNSTIAQTITDLSAFTNRYYTTTTGKTSADWIASQWSSLVSGRSWATVSRVSHTGYNQQSVMLELVGSDYPNEIVVLGGHLDSINQSGTTETTRAPGADDDASGIATLTDIIRVMASQNLRPKRTIRFYGYAAEEVGLRGSKDIATAAASAGKQVIGVMQLDMTNYKGGVDDIVLMTDYTNASLNAYVQSLISTYQPNLKQSTDLCGYGCSDHASWHNAGYAAVMPFEAKFNSSNPKIHSVNDTLANSDQTAAHALKFAKLGLSFALELGNSTGTTPPPTGSSGEFTNLSAAKGSWVYKTIVVPAGAKSLQINMSGGTGDADMYVRQGANPTTTTYACRPYKTGNTESCTLTNPVAGNWIVGLRAYSAFSGVKVVWSQQ